MFKLQSYNVFTEKSLVKKMADFFMKYYMLMPK